MDAAQLDDSVSPEEILVLFERYNVARDKLSKASKVLAHNGPTLSADVKAEMAALQRLYANLPEGSVEALATRAQLGALARDGRPSTKKKKGKAVLPIEEDNPISAAMRRLSTRVTNGEEHLIPELRRAARLNQFFRDHRPLTVASAAADLLVKQAELKTAAPGKVRTAAIAALTKALKHRGQIEALHTEMRDEVQIELGDALLSFEDRVDRPDERVPKKANWGDEEDDLVYEKRVTPTVPPHGPKGKRLLLPKAHVNVGVREPTEANFARPPSNSPLTQAEADEEAARRLQKWARKTRQRVRNADKKKLRDDQRGSQPRMAEEDHDENAAESAAYEDEEQFVAHDQNTELGGRFNRGGGKPSRKGR
jgi:hypothetical protein